MLPPGFCYSEICHPHYSSGGQFSHSIPFHHLCIQRIGTPYLIIPYYLGKESAPLTYSGSYAASWLFWAYDYVYSSICTSLHLLIPSSSPVCNVVLEKPELDMHLLNKTSLFSHFK